MKKTYTAADATETLKDTQIKPKKNLFQKLKEGWEIVTDYQREHPDQFPHASALIYFS